MAYGLMGGSCIPTSATHASLGAFRTSRGGLSAIQESENLEAVSGVSAEATMQTIKKFRPKALEPDEHPNDLLKALPWSGAQAVYMMREVEPADHVPHQRTTALIVMSGQDMDG